jgi:beta propeller repeat protein
MRRIVLPTIMAALLAFEWGCSKRSGSRDGAEDTSLDLAPDADSADLPDDPLIDLGDVIDAGDVTDGSDGCSRVSDLVGHLDIVPVPPGRSATDCGEGCRQVTFAEYNQLSVFDVWGDYLVYNTSSSESGIFRSWIWIVDLDTLDAYLINQAHSTDEYDPTIGWVSIWNEVVIYAYQQRTPEYCYSLLRFNFSTSYQDVLLTDHAHMSGFEDLQMFDDSVVWWDNRTGETGDGWFWHLRIAEREETRISSVPCFVCGVRGMDVHGSHAVFHGDNGGSGFIHLYVYDTVTSVTEQITSGNHDHCMPSIWENTVVWTDMRNGGSAASQTYADVYMYDLETGVETVVCDHPASQPAVASVWGDRIVWKDLRNDPDHPNDPPAAEVVDVYMYTISTGVESRIDLPAGRKGPMKLWDNKLYFNMVDDAGIQSVFEKTLD